MPARKQKLDIEETVGKPSKLKKLNQSNHYTFELSEYLYEHLYVSKDKLPFSIHKKKFEEAEMIFESAISSSTSTVCIVIKGPTGCGKGFLSDKLIEKYENQIRVSDIDSLPTSFIPSNFDTINSSPKSNNLKCGNTIFPSLSFSKSTINPSNEIVDKRKVVSRFTDAHFFHSIGFEKEYTQIRRSIEMLKTHSGIVLIEMTEFEFEGSIHNYIIKVLKEVFPTNLNFISLNSCAPTIIKKALEPINKFINTFNLPLKDLIEKFNGDSRAFLHDLYAISLNPNNFQVNSSRDYRTDLFHYVGKLLYPSKNGGKIFEDVPFWDLDFNFYLTFLQFYFPKFCPDIQAISSLNDNFSNFDNISWKVLKHVSIENHQNACKYAPLLSCFLFINDPNRVKFTHKFFSFSRPPLIDEAILKKKSRKAGLKPEEMYLKNLT